MTTKGIHITAFEISNLYRITFARVEWVPGVGFVRITGDNGDGKTSTLRALMAGFGGASEVISEAILNDDAPDGEGYVKIELDNGFTIRRDVTEENPKGRLVVVGPDGGKHGQARLNGWMGEHHDFDVLAFFGLKPARQTQILLGLGKDPDLAKKLAGKKATFDALYSERTPFIAEQRRARAVKKPEGEMPDAVDVSAEMERLGVLQAAQRERDDLGREVDGFRAKLAANKAGQSEASEATAAHAVENNAAMESLKAELARVEERIDTFQKQMASDVRRHEGDLAYLVSAHNTLLAAGKKVKATHEALTDPTEEIDAVKVRLSEAAEVNEQLEPWKRWERAAEELKAAEDEIGDLEAEMETIEADKRALIANADIPVEGLSFNEKAEPLLNGKVLAVASGAERIRMSVAVAIAADPELRVCLVDEANDLGLKAMKALDDEAKKHDFQIFGGRLGLEGPGEIIVSDGRAWDSAGGEPKDKAAALDAINAELARDVGDEIGEDEDMPESTTDPTLDL